MSAPRGPAAHSGVATRPARPPADVEQSPRRGRWYDTLGWVAITLGGAGFGFAAQDDADTTSTMPTTWIWVASVVLTVAGAWAVLRGRRHLMPVLDSLRGLPGNERIVLFLREFKDDPAFHRSIGTRFLWLRAIFTGQPLTAADLHTEEQQIATAVASFGRMVALGNPSDSLPPLGVERAYAADATWRGEVLAALGRAELVVLAAGSSRNLAWEVERIIERGVPTRLVLTVGHDREKYERFRWALGGYFPRGLPEYPTPGLRQRVLKSYSVRAVIWFDEDWTPHGKVLAGWVPVLDFARRTQRTVRRALKTVFVRAGLPARVTPALPRPAAVPAGIALLLAIWLIPVLVLTVLFRFLEIVGAMTIGSDSIAGSAGIGFTFVLGALVLLGAVTLPWMWRVWRGGPLAVGMARIWGVSFTLALAVFLLTPLDKEAAAHPSSETGRSITHSSHSDSSDYSDYSHDDSSDDPFGDDPFGDNSTESTAPGGWPETLPLLALTVLLSSLPLGVTTLLMRREVRAWVDSRL
ncbi:hypothetical protein [Nocardia nova]|uniref:hypothetical protein n=1 Tax=Nocardia nova TaxID=37330 RepID=UPI0033D78252